MNVFGYSSDADGAWEIRADDVKDAFAQMHGEFRTLASHEKIAWLQAHAAVYRARILELPVSLSCSSFFKLMLMEEGYRFRRRW